LKIVSLGQDFRTVLTTPYIFCECSNLRLLRSYYMKGQNIMKRVCIVINKGLIFLVCNHVKRRPGWMTIQYMKSKIELSSQRRELLCLSSNMAAVMSDGNQQCPYKTSRSAADLQQICLMKNRLTADYFSICRLFYCLQSLLLV